MRVSWCLLVGLCACGSNASTGTDCSEGFVETADGACEASEAPPISGDGTGGGFDAPTTPPDTDTPTDTTGEYEGDEPGECSDGADNDRDGLFDCDDPGCAGSPDCEGTTSTGDTGTATSTAPAEVWVSPSTGMELASIPPGTFEMGCTPEMDVEGGCQDDEYPVHDVTLTRGYYLGITEVTQAQWEAVMGSNPSYFPACGDDCPVEQVSWEDAIVFANALSALDGLTAAYDLSGTVDLDADGYRLPTEAEWEYAARAGDGTAFAGSDVIGEVAWYADNSGATTHPVAGLAPNGLGLYDMSGNVWEWCGDWYDAEYYDVSPATDPTGALSGADRVNRGGSWGSTPRNARVAYRSRNAPDNRINSLGVRLARTIP